MCKQVGESRIISSLFYLRNWVYGGAISYKEDEKRTGWSEQSRVPFVYLNFEVPARYQNKTVNVYFSSQGKIMVDWWQCW